MATKIKLLNENLMKLVINTEKSVKALVEGKEKIVVSSGVNFKLNWEIIKMKMTEKLNELNIEAQTKRLIENGRMDILKELLSTNLAKIIKPINITLTQKIKCMMGNLAKTELELVLKNLRGENFFNLSGQPIEKRVLEQKFGKKFTPFFKLNVKKELNKFDSELCQMLNRIFGEAAVKIKTRYVFIKLRKLGKTSQEMAMLLSSIDKHTKTCKRFF